MMSSSNSETQQINFNNHFSSLIEGQVVKRYKTDMHYDEKYQKHFSSADVKIIEIVRKGQNYHGQFNKGDTIRIFFNFTMERTDKLFPELNQSLPGLNEDDVFHAELDEKEDEVVQYSVMLYDLKN